jgi:DNA helicase HerA-like ATPase
VPVFAADVKGDLSGIARPGAQREAAGPRPGHRLTLSPTAFPTVFWDLFGEQGHPVRATISEMGPLLLSRLLELNEPQEGVLNVAFRDRRRGGAAAARPQGPAGHAQATWRTTPASSASQYGNVSPATVGTIQRKLLVLEKQGAAHFFGEPALRWPT